MGSGSCPRWALWAAKPCPCLVQDPHFLVQDSQKRCKTIGIRSQDLSPSTPIIILERGIEGRRRFSAGAFPRRFSAGAFPPLFRRGEDFRILPTRPLRHSNTGFLKFYPPAVFIFPSRWTRMRFLWLWNASFNLGCMRRHLSRNAGASQRNVGSNIDLAFRHQHSRLAETMEPLSAT